MVIWRPGIPVLGYFRFISKETWKLMELYLLPIKVSGSFRGSTWEFPLSVEVEAPLLPSIAASTNIFRGSFNELPYAPTYFHLLPRVSQTSSCFHKTNPNPNPKLEPPPWKLAHIQLQGKYMDLVCWLLALKLAYFPLPWNLVGGNFHGSWWK